MRSIVTRLERLEEGAGADAKRLPISVVCRFICAEKKEATGAIVFPLNGTGSRQELERESGEAEGDFLARVDLAIAALRAATK